MLSPTSPPTSDIDRHLRPGPRVRPAPFVRHKDGAIIAIWNRCATRCPTSYSAGSDSYTCPCHGGSYDTLGRVIAGPPPRPLDRFDVKIVDASGKDVATTTSASAGVPTTGAKPDDRVLIGVAFSIDDDQNPYRLHGPGEEVTGVLANLYPF